MKSSRRVHTLRLYLLRSGSARADYLRKNRVFRSIGKNAVWQPRYVPLYPELIEFGNNVFIASDVHFVTHDIAHLMLNKLPEKPQRFRERVGCVRIMDNVFVGAGTRILYNVQIGSNVIIGAGSLVTHDLEPNAVYAGVPARRIKSLDEYMQGLSQTGNYPAELAPRGNEVSPALADFLWSRFDEDRAQRPSENAQS